MKKCPNCSQVFSDDNFFCLSCGASLFYGAEAKQNPTVFQTPNDAPTRILPRPPTIQTIFGNSLKWLYLITGVWAAMGIFMFLPPEKPEKAEQSSKSAEYESRNCRRKDL